MREVLIFATWDETGEYEGFAVPHDMSPQGMADHVVKTLKEYGGYVLYPDHITVFKNGPEYPVFVVRWWLLKHYHAA